MSTSMAKGRYYLKEKQGNIDSCDIYYIPDLKRNILGLGQATEQGYDVRMRDNYLTLKDSNGRLLAKVLRSPNRLYKLRLEVGRPACLHTRMEEDTWRWHARFGHISFKTIRSMATQEMVHGLPEIQDEKECWNWKGANKEEQIKPGMFRMS